MAFTIKASASATSGFTAPTGRPSQGHLVYAANQGAWWAFFLNSTQYLNALYATVPTSPWSTPSSGSPLMLTAAHNGEARNFGFAYANIAPYDVLHMVSSYGAATQTSSARFTLSAANWNNTNAEDGLGVGSHSPAGSAVALTSAPSPTWSSINTSGDRYAWTGAGTDAGSSWTIGSPVETDIYNGETQYVCSGAMFSLGSGNILSLCDNSPTVGNISQVIGAVFASGSWGSAAGIATAFTATDANNWGACARASSDIHVVALSDSASSFMHWRYNGSTWSGGSVVGTLDLIMQSGISLVTDGTSVWAAAIDQSNNIQYNKWTSGGGWGGWTVLEATRANTPSYITGAYNGSNQIMWAWSEVNGSNFDIIGSTLATSTPPPTATGGAALLMAM